mmetsp:Transcript_7843/g.22449  ORF Transcript_7843/g.22449 Transcript_7843/m.22449 type:complete len:269 (-) Transcript_7843:660-1466(-)
MLVLLVSTFASTHIPSTIEARPLVMAEPPSPFAIRSTTRGILDGEEKNFSTEEVLSRSHTQRSLRTAWQRGPSFPPSPSLEMTRTNLDKTPMSTLSLARVLPSRRIAITRAACRLLTPSPAEMALSRFVPKVPSDPSPASNSLSSMEWTVDASTACPVSFSSQKEEIVSSAASLSNLDLDPRHLKRIASRTGTSSYVWFTVQRTVIPDIESFAMEFCNSKHERVLNAWPRTAYVTPPVSEASSPFSWPRCLQVKSTKVSMRLKHSSMS